MKSIGIALAIVFATHSASAQMANFRVEEILASTGFKGAAAFLERDYDRFVSEVITLTEIPSPPFKEQKRAAAFLDMLRGLGLSDVEMDAEGNVMGVRKGMGSGSMLALVAHLDSVFPEGTDVRVRRDGTKLMAPGVGDDARGLALLLTLGRAMNAGNLRTNSDILFVGSVGEEGEGDLRGVRFLLQSGKYKGKIQRFIAIDGGDGDTITNGALGSRRYRVTFKGPGGHSFGAFGVVSPSLAMGNVIARLSRTQVPATPKTTFNVGVVTGGTSVNAIPTDVSMDVDMRSESPAELDRLVGAFRSLVEEVVDEENRVRSIAEGRLVAEIKLIGDRSGGETALTHPLVATATAALKAFGLTPRYGIGSTDSNVPISMGIPAVTIGRGAGGRNHSLDEWTDVEKGKTVRGAEVALAVVLGAAIVP